MITVLFAASGVASGCQDVPMRSWADPDVGPGGRNSKGFDATKVVRITNWASIGADVAEVLTGALAAYARHGIGDVAQPGGFGRLDRCSHFYGLRLLVPGVFLLFGLRCCHCLPHRIYDLCIPTIYVYVHRMTRIGG